MRLFLLRHAEAADTTPDRARPLTPKGISDTRKLGALLRNRNDFDVHSILYSPYVRAFETADVFADAAGIDHLTAYASDLITPMDDPALIVPTLTGATDNLLLIGHNPHLSLLASLLLSGSVEGLDIGFKKCSMLALDRHGNRAGGAPAWSLRWFITPKLFR